MTQNVYLYLIVAALTLYAIRALPMTLIRKDIKSPFIRNLFRVAIGACIVVYVAELLI